MTEVKLLTPGPTQIPEKVLAAMGRGNVHHRSPEFAVIFDELRSDLQWLIPNAPKPLLLTCSGTGAMEAALCNLLRPNEKVVVLNAGKFGSRWAEIGGVLGLTVVEHRAEWGESPGPDAILQTLKENPDTRALCLQYCETSTGVLHFAPEITQAAKALLPNLLTIVDGISAVGTLPIGWDDAPWDVLVTGSQKALMVPPGLALLFISGKAWEIIEQNPPRSYYFNLKAERKAQEQGCSAWTPAISLVLGLKAALALIKEVGVKEWYERHKQISEMAQRRLTELGFSLVNSARSAPGVTAAFPPQGLSAPSILRAVLSEHHIRLAGGQGPFKNRVVRIGHMGAVAIKDAESALDAIAKAL